MLRIDPPVQPPWADRPIAAVRCCVLVDDGLGAPLPPVFVFLDAGGQIIEPTSTDPAFGFVTDAMMTALRTEPVGAVDPSWTWTQCASHACAPLVQALYGLTGAVV